MTEDTTDMRCSGLLPDLTGATLLRLEAGERLWKLYFLRPASDHGERVEHRIYTKEQRDGRIGLVSYSFRMSPASAPATTNLAYATDIPKDALNPLIWNVVRESKLGPDELEIIDLSRLTTFEAQLAHLRELESGG